MFWIILPFLVCCAAMTDDKHFCAPEVYYHYYRSGNKTELIVNAFGKTEVGNVGSLVNTHIARTAQFRYCLATGLGAAWQHYPANWTYYAYSRDVLKNGDDSDLAKMHHNMPAYITAVEKGKAARKVIKLMGRDNLQLSGLDVHYTVQIIRRFSGNNSITDLSTELLNVSARFMTSGKNVLHESGRFNTTNEFLEFFENHLDGLSVIKVPTRQCETVPQDESAKTELAVDSMDNSDVGVFAEAASNISVFYVNPQCSNITGIALYRQKSEPQKRRFYQLGSSTIYRFIYMNETEVELMDEPDLQVASFIPQLLWEELLLGSEIQSRETMLVLKVYGNSALFVETREISGYTPITKILSISIPGFKRPLPVKLPYILRNNEYVQSKVAALTARCGYWNYRSWVVENQPLNSQKRSLMLCYTSHLTPFSILVDVSLIAAQYRTSLDLISLVGCASSIVGLVGIFLTALRSRKWRAEPTTKVLLNFSVVLLLQMVGFLMLYGKVTVGQPVAYCIALGALLQYSVLVLLSWMLVMAYVQFRHHVTVLGTANRPHFLLQVGLAAWGLPALFLSTAVSIARETYVKAPNAGICYPTGGGLLYGVIVPISAIMVANLITYLVVVYNIFFRMQSNDVKLIAQKLKVCLLLFFLLGCPWIFGILYHLKAGIVFSYLFCLTATLQGVVFFVYFVLLKKLPRKVWLNCLCGRSIANRQRMV